MKVLYLILSTAYLLAVLYAFWWVLSRIYLIRATKMKDLSSLYQEIALEKVGGWRWHVYADAIRLKSARNKTEVSDWLLRTYIKSQG